MKIDGKLIASQIKTDLKEKITSFRQKNIIPHLAVILIGNDPSSETYVRQKLKFGEEIGGKVSLEVGPRTRSDLVRTVNKLNRDTSVHGVIIQRPLPIDISKEELDRIVIPAKDVDGFRPNSPFTPPIANAVIKTLEYVEKDLCNNPNSPLKQNYCEPFFLWLKNQKILVIGRGETAGKPITEILQKLGAQITVAHSKTTNFEELCLASNIIISCVGRPNIVRHQFVTNKTVLIGVGLHQENGRLRTDYNQEEIADKVAYYTPVPGGVGPVNVACLFENLLNAIN